MKEEMYYQSPVVVLIDITMEGVLCQSGMVIESGHEGFVDDSNNPDSIW